MGRDLSSILRVCFVCTRHAGDQLAQGDFNRTERNVIRSDCCQYSVASSAMFRHSSLCRFIVLAVVTVVVAAVNSGSGSKVEILPACKCTWPEIGAEGAEEQQLCPPLHVKCDMCMNGVHAIRFGNHPRSVCGLFRQDEENVGFCNTMGTKCSNVGRKSRLSLWKALMTTVQALEPRKKSAYCSAAVARRTKSSSKIENCDRSAANTSAPTDDDNTKTYRVV